MISIESQISNGDWVDEPDIDQYVKQILERDVWFAPRVHREPMTSKADVLAFLEAGNKIKYDDFWYAQLRKKVPEPEIDWEKYEKERLRREKADHLCLRDHEWYDDCVEGHR